MCLWSMPTAQLKHLKNLKHHDIHVVFFFFPPEVFKEKVKIIKFCIKK